MAVTVYDWDLIGKNDYLGEFEIKKDNILNLNEFEEKIFSLKKVKSGKVRLKVGLFERDIALEGETLLKNSKFFASVNSNLVRDYVIALGILLDDILFFFWIIYYLLIFV